MFPCGGFDRRSIWRWLFLFLATLAASAPLWLVTRPPMQDLPEHAANVVLFLRLQDPGFPYASMFAVNWFTPYLTGYLLLIGLTPWLGVTTACKCLLTLTLVGLGLSSALLLRRRGHGGLWSLLTLPAFYGFAFQMGLLNFLVAAPLGLLVLWLGMRREKAPGAANGVGLSAALLALFFCHALVCAFVMSTLMLRAILLRGEGGCWGRLTRLAWPLSAMLPPALLWILRTRAAVVDAGTQWELGVARLLGLPGRVLGESLCWPMLATLLAMALLPIVCGMRLRMRELRSPDAAPLWVCAATLLLLPNVIFGNHYTYERFALFLPVCWLLALSPSAVERRAPWRRVALFGGAAWMAAWFVFLGGQMLAFEREQAPFARMLALMAPGQRILSATPLCKSSANPYAFLFLHYGAWYGAEKDGVVDPGVWEPVQMVHHRAGEGPAVRLEDFAWRPTMHQMRQLRGDDYRYFLFRSQNDPTGFLQVGTGCPLRLLYAEPPWRLYERVGRCQPSQ